MELLRHMTIECFMKRDGRSFDHKTLEEIRLMAVERVREGEPAAKVIEAYGFNRTTIYKWLNAGLRPGVGIKALRSTKATGRPRTLTPAQERQVFRWVNGRDPRQYGLNFGLWTRAVVAELIEQKFGVKLGLTAVGELLAKLGLTPQKPLQRAYQRDPKRLNAGNARPTRLLPNRPGKKAPRSFSGTNRAFGQIRFMARPGACAVRRRGLSAQANDNRSALPPPSMPKGRSGSARTQVRSMPSCLLNC